MKNTINFIAARACLTGIVAIIVSKNGAWAADLCSVQSAATRTPVVELYTSEGCSSCPPADKWLSGFKPGAAGPAQEPVVVQAFHVGYWDYIGWVDRFANPAHTLRQRQIASLNQQTSVYTPQAVLNGRDWRDWGKLPARREPAGVSITLKQVAADQFEAFVGPAVGIPGAAGAASRWSAYWSVTEHGHSSKVKAGENAGETLQHDFVVRQYTPAGDYPLDAKTPQKLTLRSIAATPGHARQINLVVFDPSSGKTLQAVSVGC
jgi:hypothetical protein